MIGKVGRDQNNCLIPEQLAGPDDGSVMLVHHDTNCEYQLATAVDCFTSRAYLGITCCCKPLYNPSTGALKVDCLCGTATNVDINTNSDSNCNVPILVQGTKTVSGATSLTDTIEKSVAVYNDNCYICNDPVTGCPVCKPVVYIPTVKAGEYIDLPKEDDIQYVNTLPSSPNVKNLIYSVEECSSINAMTLEDIYNTYYDKPNTNCLILNGCQVSCISSDLSSWEDTDGNSYSTSSTTTFTTADVYEQKFYSGNEDEQKYYELGGKGEGGSSGGGHPFSCCWTYGCDYPLTTYDQASNTAIWSPNVSLTCPSNGSSLNLKVQYGYDNCFCSNFGNKLLSAEYHCDNNYNYYCVCSASDSALICASSYSNGYRLTNFTFAGYEGFHPNYGAVCSAHYVSCACTPQGSFTRNIDVGGYRGWYDLFAVNRSVDTCYACRTCCTDIITLTKCDNFYCYCSDGTTCTGVLCNYSRVGANGFNITLSNSSKCIDLIGCSAESNIDSASISATICGDIWGCTKGYLANGAMCTECGRLFGVTHCGAGSSTPVGFYANGLGRLHDLATGCCYLTKSDVEDTGWLEGTNSRARQIGKVVYVEVRMIGNIDLTSSGSFIATLPSQINITREINGAFLVDNTNNIPLYGRIKTNGSIATWKNGNYTSSIESTSSIFGTISFPID